MPIRDLKDQIGRLPTQPGVYLYSNGAGETIYVGRATVLRDRVRSYLGAYGSSPKTDALLDEVVGLDVIVTDSVVEALALENNLIKQRSPRYNILLRDDKNYPYLQITTTEAFPRVLVARRVARDGNFYAGPFLPASFARKTMSLTHRLFGIRSCNEVITGKRGRPCLEYDIKRCVAPCVDTLCSEAEYGEAVDRTRMFLEGRNDELLGELRTGMRAAADRQHYEQAAQLRDAIRNVEALRDRRQKMATARLGDRDAFGVKAGPAGAIVQVFQMRGGRVVERIELAAGGDDAPRLGEAEVVRAALQQFYADRAVPPEIHLPVSLDRDDDGALARWLESRAGRRVRLHVPRRGDARGLLELAARNAGLAYEARYGAEAQAHGAALDELRAVLGMPARPRRVECFDISTIQGAESVASMVVCEDGSMRRSEYRKFRIRNAALARPDDFAAMEEVVLRRYRRLLEQGGPFPDLVIVDGGKGQLSAAYKAFEQLGLANLMAIGIAKREELIVTRDRSDPIALPRRSGALRLVQRIRDEAHRFAVTFHRRARAMRDLRSELDAVPGIGPARRRLLLERFGSTANVRRASREELRGVVGARLAEALMAHFTG
ncbi:MAG: excinuclease ABC subunit UvrC [Acidobacteria bacterium]|nr:excinuclease ABC subunit UvrC [Acidobacteriota bacterium]